MNISEKLFNFRQSDNITFYDTLTNLISNFTLVNEYLNIKEKEFSIINKDDTIIVILKKELENNSFIDSSNILGIINNDNEGYIYIYKLKKELNNIIDELENIEDMRYNDVLDEEKLKSLILKKENKFKDDCSNDLLDNIKNYINENCSNETKKLNNEILKKHIGKKCLEHLYKLSNIKFNNTTIKEYIKANLNKNVENLYKDIIKLEIKDINFYYFKILYFIYKKDNKGVCDLINQETYNNIIKFNDYFQSLKEIKLDENKYIELFKIIEKFPNLSIPIFLFIDTIHDFTDSRIKSKKNINSNNIDKLFKQIEIIIFNINKKSKDDLIQEAKNLGIKILYNDNKNEIEKKIKLHKLHKEAENLGIKISYNQKIDDKIDDKIDEIEKKIKLHKLHKEAENLGIIISPDEKIDEIEKKIKEFNLNNQGEEETKYIDDNHEYNENNKKIKYIKDNINILDIDVNKTNLEEIMKNLNIKYDTKANKEKLFNEHIQLIKTIIENLEVDDIIKNNEKSLYKKENKEFIQSYKERFFIKKNNNKYIFSDECKSTILCNVFDFFNENKNDNLIKNLPTILYSIIKSLDENNIFYLYILYFFINHKCNLAPSEKNILEKYYDINSNIDTRIYSILWTNIPYIDKWSIDFSNKDLLDISKKVILPSSLVDANKTTSTTYFKDYNTAQNNFTLWSGKNFNYIFNENNCNLKVTTKNSNNNCDYKEIDYELNSYCDINLGYNGKNSSTNFFIKLKGIEQIEKLDDRYLKNKIDISTIEKIIYSNKSSGPSVNEIFSIIEYFKNRDNPKLPLSFIDSLFSLKRIGDLGQIIESKLNKIPLYTDDKMEALIGIAFGCSIITSCGKFLIWYDGETDSLKSLLTYDNQFTYKKNCKSFDIKRNNSKEYFDQLKKIEYFGDIFNVEIKDNKICKKDYCSI
jgi:hypothetical protein